MVTSLKEMDWSDQRYNLILSFITDRQSCASIIRILKQRHPSLKRIINVPYDLWIHLVGVGPTGEALSRYTVIEGVEVW